MTAVPPARPTPPQLPQPELGLRGLLLVVPIAVFLAVGAGGEGSVLVLAPLVTYALPLVLDSVYFPWNRTFEIGLVARPTF